MSELDNLNEFSKKIGETLRYVAFGVIATDFAILTAKIDFFKDKMTSVSQLVLWSLGLSILGLVCDYLHSLFGFINSKYKYEKQIEESEIGNAPIYHLGYLFFYLKQLLIIVAAILLIFSTWKII